MPADSLQRQPLLKTPHDPRHYHLPASAIRCLPPSWQRPVCLSTSDRALAVMVAGDCSCQIGLMTQSVWSNTAESHRGMLRMGLVSNKEGRVANAQLGGASKVKKKGIVLHKILYYISKIIGNPVTTPNRCKTAHLFSRSDRGCYHSLVSRQIFLINHGPLGANNPHNLLCRLVVTESLFNQEKTKLGRFSCSLKEVSGLNPLMHTGWLVKPFWRPGCCNGSQSKHRRAR